jgi:hypothetical protein
MLIWNLLDSTNNSLNNNLSNLNLNYLNNTDLNNNNISDNIEVSQILNYLNFLNNNNKQDLLKNLFKKKNINIDLDKIFIIGRHFDQMYKILDEISIIMNFSQPTKNSIKEMFISLDKLSNVGNENFIRENLIMVMKNYRTNFMQKPYHYFHFCVHIMHDYLQNSKTNFSNENIESMNSQLKKLIKNHCNHNHSIETTEIDYIHQILQHIFFYSLSPEKAT